LDVILTALNGVLEKTVQVLRLPGPRPNFDSNSTLNVSPIAISCKAALQKYHFLEQIQVYSVISSIRVLLLPSPLLLLLKLSVVEASSLEEVREVDNCL
jgi:hypothetical protein